MSGEGPESIPTSADPRSKRPTKKRALTPVSEQAASVDALFAKPDQDIRIPQPGGGANSRQRNRLAPPPEIVTNVQGSSAGAGSGEFHVYKASRRREYERLRVMDEELKVEVAQKDFETRTAELSKRDEEKTRRNREKRDKKKKARLAAAANGGKPDGGSGPAANGGTATATEMKDGGGDESVADKARAAAAAEPALATGLVIHEEDD